MTNSPAGSDRTIPAESLPGPVVGGSAGIANRLREAIVSGRYGFGERLPAERDLATHFGASRSTVREALRTLEELNLVSRRIGSGTFVTFRQQPGHDDIAEITSPLELIEVRSAIEPHMTRLAVVNATARDLERLADALSALETAGSDREIFSSADAAFHQALAQSSHNQLMVWLYNQINEVRNHTQWSAMKDKILTADRIAEYNRQHRELYEAIASRDVDAALECIVRHLDKARRDLMGADSA